jgi:AcrR family transcriptional regulator
MALDHSTAQTDGMRSTIIEAARELFARFGYKKTTLDDIAHSLGKGKSSLYYYFKNKEEIFQAVVDWEEEILFSRLKGIVNSSLPADEKLRKYVETRMATIRELVNYHKALSDDSMVFDFLDHLKGKGEKEEVVMLKAIMDEGVASGIFQVKNAQMASVAIATALKGLEIPLFRSANLVGFDELKVQITNVLNILFFGLMKRD